MGALSTVGVFEALGERVAVALSVREGVGVPDADGEGEAVLVLVLVRDTVLDAVVVTLAVKDLLLERDAEGVLEGVALTVEDGELDAL